MVTGRWVKANTRLIFLGTAQSVSFVPAEHLVVNSRSSQIN